MWKMGSLLLASRRAATLYMFHFQSRYLSSSVSTVPTVIDLSAFISTDSILIPCTRETADTLSIAVCLCILVACFPRRKTNPSCFHASLGCQISTNPCFLPIVFLHFDGNRLLTSTCVSVRQRSWKLQTLLVSLAQ